MSKRTWWPADSYITGGGSPPLEPSRGERILDAIEDEVSYRINPEQEDCWNCGGEGYTYYCIDGCCIDAEGGCEDCSIRCRECVEFNARFARLVRIEVLKLLDIDLGAAWVKSHAPDRWSDDTGHVLLHMHVARAGCDAFTPEERADSGCWVEGLL